MTRKRSQAGSDVPEWTVSKFLVTILFLFSFFFWRDWVCLDKTAEYFSSLFCFISFFFLGVTGSVRIRRPNISRHYFVFVFFFWRDWVCSDKTAKNFSSLFFSSFSFFSLYLLYYAQDSWKKWQEKKERLGLISRMTASKSFSSLFSFFSFFGVSGSVRIRRPKISRHYFVFLFFSLSTILRAG